MSNNNLNLFISYSHEDIQKDGNNKDYVENFKKYLSKLEKNNILNIYSDRENLPGDNFQEKIDSKLENMDIFCPLISEKYLKSKHCRKELNKAYELKKHRNVQVVPILISKSNWLKKKSFEWLEYSEHSKEIVLPTDGKPIEDFNTHEEAWEIILKNLRELIDKELKIRNLEINDLFEEFLQDTVLFEKAHNNKSKVLLNDIFIAPDLIWHDFSEEQNKNITFNDLNFLETPHIIISGDSQSGKTTLCKKLFKDLYERNFLPVYVKGNEKNFKNIEKSIKKYFKEQYNEKLDDQYFNRIIPILDDFDNSTFKQKTLKFLLKYPYSIITIDDISNMNISSKEMEHFNRFQIQEHNAKLRYELIRKWLYLSDKEIRDYKEIDKNVELINNLLGKNFNAKIMSSYPFFILTLLIAFHEDHDNFSEITSQGHCYQALIYCFLRKKGINNEIDGYLNFLKEFSFSLYTSKKEQLPKHEFERFLKDYLKKYNIKNSEKLIDDLSFIISFNNLNNISFKEKYLYYYFVANYIADYIEEKNIEIRINEIFENLHVNENAYISIFLSHHSKNTKILETLENKSSSLFKNLGIATLEKEKMEFFDENMDFIIEKSLSEQVNPEDERESRLNEQSSFEKNSKKHEDVEDNSSGKDLRRAIKTVEVMGTVIKNRWGSIEKSKIQNIIQGVITIYLKILCSYLMLIRQDEERKELIDYISFLLKKIIKEDSGLEKVKENKIKDIAEMIFWNINYFFIDSLFEKIIHSFGSENLIDDICIVCDKMRIPATQIIKQEVLMWYNKSVNIDEIKDMINDKKFSKIAERVIKNKVVDHCLIHPTNRRERQQIRDKLNINTKLIMLKNMKNID